MSVSPVTNERFLTWKTPTKKFLKWSNISVKKYHQTPTLGVKSDAVKLIVVSCTDTGTRRTATYMVPHELTAQDQSPRPMYATAAPTAKSAENMAT